MDTLTSGQAAKWCGVSFRTVLRWIERGELKAYKLPGRGDARIAVEDFVDFLTRHRIPIPEDIARSRRPRILIIDDEAVARKLLVTTLKDYETQTADDGFSAGAALVSFRPELITLDLKMPGLGGVEVLRFIRSMPDPINKVKILVVSGMSEAELDQARKAGADEILTKPVDHKLLQQKVSKLLEG